MGALERFLETYFGMKTRALSHDITTGGAGAISQIVPNNPDRLMLVIMNISASDMYAAPDAHPSGTRGILLQNGGGVLTLNAAVDGALVGFDWHVYCAAATQKVFALETEGA